jgi:hypothetical protein
MIDDVMRKLIEKDVKKIEIVSHKNKANRNHRHYYAINLSRTKSALPEVKKPFVEDNCRRSRFI